MFHKLWLPLQMQDCYPIAWAMTFLLAFSLADDHQALIWDIQQMPRAIEDPILAYTAEGEIDPFIFPNIYFWNFNYLDIDSWKRSQF